MSNYGSFILKFYSIEFWMRNTQLVITFEFSFIFAFSFSTILAYKIPKEDVQSLSQSFSKLEEGE